MAKTKIITVEDDIPVEPLNHRTIVGRRRRANTETRIILAAIKIFAEQGPDAPVIEDFIKAAGIARGTFYNYFKSTDELLQATSNWLSEDVMMSIEAEIRSLKDPAIRFGLGFRLWMRWAQANPSWSLFIARIWNFGEYEKPLRDIRAGIKKKVFLVSDPYVAWDVLAGAIRQAMFKIGKGGTSPSYGDAVVQMCLQALGLANESSKEIMALQLPDVAGR